MPIAPSLLRDMGQERSSSAKCAADAGVVIA